MSEFNLELCFKCTKVLLRITSDYAQLTYVKETPIQLRLYAIAMALKAVPRRDNLDEEIPLPPTRLPIRKG